MKLSRFYVTETPHSCAVMWLLPISAAAGG